MKFQISLTIFLLLYISQLYAQTSRVRMGIAGMTHDHVWAILNRPQHDGMELVGFAEPNKELALAYLKRANLPESLWYPTLEELIDKTKPQAICDFRSTFEHLETVQKCAPKGIHVMVEKPLAVNLKHAREMESLAMKHKIHLITNYETTWYASHRTAYDILHTEKKIGALRKVVVMDGHKGPREIGCSEAFLSWLTDPIKNGGGAIMDFGCYGANIMTWLMKGIKPTSVSAIAQTNKPSVYPRVDDEATITVSYPGVQGIFQASWNWPYDRKDTEIYGQSGFLLANKQMQMNARIGTDRNSAEQKIDLSPLPSPYNDPFTYFAAIVSGSIHAGLDLGSLPINMVTMEILDAAVKSAKSGKVIKLK